jgi:hypothetical protein
VVNSKRPKRGVGQCVPTILYVCGMYVGCMYVLCNHAPGPSVLGQTIQPVKQFKDKDEWKNQTYIFNKRTKKQQELKTLEYSHFLFV